MSDRHRRDLEQDSSLRAQNTDIKEHYGVSAIAPSTPALLPSPGGTMYWSI